VKKWDARIAKTAISEIPVSTVQTMINGLIHAHQTEHAAVKRRKKHEHTQV